MPEKTVFILGAGFSVPSGVPDQSSLLHHAFEIEKSEPPKPSTIRTEIRRGSVHNFLNEVFGITYKDIPHFSLEDFYTPIHHCISNNIYLKNITTNRLKLVESNLNYLLAKAIDRGHDESKEVYIKSFVEKIDNRLKRCRQTDMCSVISMNWDIILDRLAFERMQISGGCLDYGCHCVDIEKDGGIIPALVAKERGKHLFKLLKLHGSLNWVFCPSCHRLFAHKNEKTGIKAILRETKCRVCKSSQKSVNLEHSIILPTFRKDLTSFHFQHIWNQAAIELSEATRIVFIGYSFPLADFDFRTLITRTIGKRVEVDVVLFDKKYPNRIKHTPEGKRYQNYFGSKIRRIHYCGVEEWIENHMDEVLP